ncbi:zinc-dependent alcohol dehydrogenase [Dermatobacter hominis]|uniref:zinc-dependent alcohol dehydrogenase n=1 Tax=Dermatobacter hominis TaxID=2884263 RepID=UPI001D124341|nr:alcohol dehydrogenase catalytic domain-containing protein [Dermatobacter hominis]UDY35831.1 alcohol dehydrogenase catalytic domain-containing protein [Dermatobacter hominis]
MRAVRNTERGIEVLDVASPESPDGLVRVRVRSAGICGSDLHLIEWGPLPVTLGHEFAGVLDDGTEVAVQPQTPCDVCDCCLRGDPHLCREILSRTHGVSIDGGLADEVWVDPRAVIALPGGVRLGDAGLVEPLAVAVHGIDIAEVSPGMRVLVIGAGSIGLCAVAAGAVTGADVDLAARYPHQIEAGEKVGAGTALGTDYDVVIEAAGSQSAIDQAVNLARPGGTIVAMATYWSPIEIGLGFTTKELQLRATSGYGVHRHSGVRDFVAAADLLARVPEVVDALVTHRFGLDDAKEAFRVAGDRSSGAIKVQLIP